MASAEAVIYTCPQGDFGRILHTGDARLDERYLALLPPAALAPDLLYLDCTFGEASLVSTCTMAYITLYAAAAVRLMISGFYAGISAGVIPGCSFMCAAPAAGLPVAQRGSAAGGGPDPAGQRTIARLHQVLKVAVRQKIRSKQIARAYQHLHKCMTYIFHTFSNQLSKFD